MFKKILSISALSISALLLILSVVDVFADRVALFELLPLKLATVLMLILSLAVTVVACFSGSWRRPLLLVACLLQTPVAGAMAVVWVYGLCFPEVMPLQALFPFLVALTALASVIQAVVVIVGEGIYEPVEDPEETEDLTTYFDELSAEGMDDDFVPAEVRATPSATASEEKPVARVMPRKTLPTADELDDADDDLAPIPKRRRSAPAVDPAPVQEASPVKPQVENLTYTDPFALLEEETWLDQRKNTAQDPLDRK